MNSELSGEKLYTVPQASEYSGLSEVTFWRWLREGKIASTRLGRKVFIRKSQLQRLVNEQVTIRV